jgi:hypothetical protein
MDRPTTKTTDSSDITPIRADALTRLSQLKPEPMTKGDATPPTKTLIFSPMDGYDKVSHQDKTAENPEHAAITKAATDKPTNNEIVTHNADGSTTRLSMNGSGKPDKVTVSKPDGSSTSVSFDANGNPVISSIERTGPNPDDAFSFKLPDGTEYRLLDLNPIITGKGTVVTPEMRITKTDGKGGTIYTDSFGGPKGWAVSSIEHDQANGDRTYTYFNSPNYGTYSARVTKNSDGGYNVEFSKPDGSPLRGMQNYRMVPNSDGSQTFTYMKPDGTIDHAETTFPHDVQ